MTIQEAAWEIRGRVCNSTTVVWGVGRKEERPCEEGSSIEIEIDLLID